LKEIEGGTGALICRIHENKTCKIHTRGDEEANEGCLGDGGEGNRGMRSAFGHKRL
jgi:hypothetical protein